MRPDHRNLQTRISKFIEGCRDRGLALTHQRMAIYRALARTDEHPTADAIYRRVHVRYPTISLATVYKTLETLQKAGLVSKYAFFSEAARYDANLAPHHHRLCVKCGRVEDFYDPSLDRLPSLVGAPKRFEVLDCQVQVNGLCPRCRRPRRRRLRGG